MPVISFEDYKKKNRNGELLDKEELKEMKAFFIVTVQFPLSGYYNFVRGFMGRINTINELSTEQYPHEFKNKSKLEHLNGFRDFLETVDSKTKMPRYQMIFDEMTEDEDKAKYVNYLKRIDETFETGFKDIIKTLSLKTEKIEKESNRDMNENIQANQKQYKKPVKGRK